MKLPDPSRSGTNSGQSARERWDARYRERLESERRQPADVVVRAVEILARFASVSACSSPDSAGESLDLGCGLGRNSLYLAQHGWRVTAVDVSPIALQGIADERTAGRRILPVCADLEAGEFTIEPESFDLIVDVFYLQRDLFPAIRTGLRTGGIFAAEMPIVDPDAPLMNRDYLLEAGELAAFFADWEILLSEEGLGDHGRKSARLIARKTAPGPQNR